MCIIVATDLERRFLKEFPVYISGIGKKAYERTKEIIQNERPSFIISAGVSAGLSPKVKVGEIVIPTEIITCSGNILKLPYIKTRHAQLGPFLETESVIKDPEKKLFLYERTGAIASDMESASVVKAALEEDVPVFCIRAISDSYKMKIPEILEDTIDESGRILYPRLIRSTILFPYQIVHLAKVALGFIKAMTSLNLFLSKIYPSLPA